MVFGHVRPVSAAQSFDAFTQGRALANDRQARDERQEVGNAFANGGYEAAAQTAGSQGNMQLATALSNELANRSQQERQQAMQEMQIAGGILMAASNMPPEQAGSFVQQQFGARGLEDLMPLASDPTQYRATAMSFQTVMDQVGQQNNERNFRRGVVEFDEAQNRQDARQAAQIDAATQRQLNDLNFREGQEGRARADARQAMRAEQAGARQEQVQAGQREQRSLAQFGQRTSLVIDSIDRAIGQSGRGNTGSLGGGITRSLGPIGQSARDMASTLDTIQANVGFQELEQMRRNSPTGGALGQVTEREIALLQSVLGSLEQTQSADQLDANLERAKVQIRKSFANIARAYEQDYGVAYQGPGADLLKEEQSGGDDIPTISDPSKARRLPSGSQFRTPDGRVLRVP